jgi:ribosome maturation factor RimP
MGTKVPIFIMQMLETIKSMLLELIEGTDCFIVEAKSSADHTYQFYIDADTGFNLGKSVSITRQLRKKIEETGLYPEGNYGLEVSSPGLDTPLANIRQYKKNIDRLIEITTQDEAQKPIIGRLKTVTEDQIELTITDKKKKTSTEQAILFNNIKKAIIQVEF